MGLLSKLKSLLGMEEESRTAGSGVDVTVERESSTGTEQDATDSVASTDDDEHTDGDEHSDGDERTDDDEPAATETTAAASTESLVDEEHTEDPTRAAEPAEAAVSEDESAAEPAAESDDGEPVSNVKGIGPAYASRLEDAGVATVSDLAVADAEELADRTDLSAKRIGRWIDSAQDHD